jgi:hypothetical protein
MAGGYVKKLSTIPPEIASAKQAAPDVGLGRWRIAVESMEVHSDEDYRQAAAVLVKLKTAQSDWKAYWERLVGAAKAAYDLLRAEQNLPLKELEDLRQKIQSHMAKFKSEQTAKVSRMGASMETATAALRSEMEARVKAYAIQGNLEASASVQAELDLLPDSRIFRYTAPPVAGVTELDSIEIEVTDLALFVKAIADGVLPLYGEVMGKIVPILNPRESLIRELAKSMGDGFSCPGVKVTNGVSYRITGSKR